MSTITKERVANLLQFNSEGSDCHANAEQWEVHELARIALASLEAEPAGWQVKKYGGNWVSIKKEDVDHYRFNEELPVREVYTAPPAPANAEPVAWLWSHRKHPSEVSLVRPEDDERAEGAHWSGWSCQALYAAPPAPVSVPAAMEMDDDFDSAFEHGKAVGWNAYRAAMLHGAEPVSNRDELPDGWVACNERMPSAGEKVLAYRPDAPESNDPLIKMATYVGGSAHGHGFDCYCKPTHWMPLPAAPQQEA